jgi:hypothetical protein
MLGTQAITILHVWTDDNKQEDANFPILYMAIKGWELHLFRVPARFLRPCEEARKRTGKRDL